MIDFTRRSDATPSPAAIELPEPRITREQLMAAQRVVERTVRELDPRADSARANRPTSASSSERR